MTKRLIRICIISFFSTFIAAAASADEMLIKPETVKQWMDIEKTFFIVDRRDKESFAEDHIPGAVNIPAGGFISDTQKTEGRPHRALLLVGWYMTQGGLGGRGGTGLCAARRERRTALAGLGNREGEIDIWQTH